MRAKGPWQPKTRRNRVVPVSSKLGAVLRSVLRNIERNTEGAEIGPDGGASGDFRECATKRPRNTRTKDTPLFLTPKGKRWNPDNLTHAFRSRMDDAGLSWTLLDLRHTFASHVIRKPGMTYARLAALMGNSPEICRRHYAHLATEEMGADVEF